MKCPKCGKELEEGKLMCEVCGEEINMVPDFDIELESTLSESLSQVADDIVVDDKVYDDDLNDEFNGIFNKRNFGKYINLKLLAIVTGVMAAVILGGTGILAYRISINNSYEYQYEKAVKYAAANDYATAISYLERAISIEPSECDTVFLLAKYYKKNGDLDSALLMLREIIRGYPEYAHKDEVYDMLLTEMEALKEYGEMAAILNGCDIERILAKYNKYAAFMPEVNKSGGVYDELISITLKGNTEGIVYYTLDGQTPTTNSMVYETPILLESGEYVIKAFFVNMYGACSDVITENYYINLKAPAAAVVNYDSGTYTSPCTIEVYHDDATKIYYTIDGTIPDKNSIRYTQPIEMPYGISNFSFIAIDDSGLASDVVRRTYQLEIQANFTPELALQVLTNNLWAKGVITDIEGHIANKLGLNRYRVRTAALINEEIYYIFAEEYVDTTGSEHQTSNLYAVNSQNGDLYRAYKYNEGRYNLREFN